MSNLFIIQAHAARSASLDPLQKFKFRMTVPGLPTGIGFQKISGLSEENAIVEYNESGHDHRHKLPGRPSVPDVTCERGSYADKNFQEVMQRSWNNPDFRFVAIIEQLTRFGAIARTYKLAEAWVSKWEGSDLDATTDDVAIETMTITFEYYL